MSVSFTLLFGPDGGLVQARIFSFLTVPSLVRLSQASRSIAVAARDESLWKEVLHHQFDVAGQPGRQKELVKKLHVGASDGWEGLCLDADTAHWTPYPLIIEVHLRIKKLQRVFVRFLACS